jgi:hypothetical protein
MFNKSTSPDLLFPISYNFTCSFSMKTTGRFRRREARLISLRGISKQRSPSYMQLLYAGTKKSSWSTPVHKPASFPSSRCNSGEMSSLPFYHLAHYLLMLRKTRFFTTSVGSLLNILLPRWILPSSSHPKLNAVSHCVSLGNIWIVCGNPSSTRSRVSSSGRRFDVYGQPRACLSHGPRRQFGICSVHRDRYHEEAHRVHV